MSLKRTIRIDLGQYSEEWRDSYLEFYTSGIQDQLSLQKTIRKLEREQKLVEQEIKDTGDTSLDDKVTDILERIALSVYDEIKKHFVKGIVIGEAVLKEDIMELDIQIAKDIYGKLSGSLEKKA